MSFPAVVAEFQISFPVTALTAMTPTEVPNTSWFPTGQRQTCPR